MSGFQPYNVAKASQTNFCNTTTRCDAIPLKTAKFSYVHISKNSGVSWIRELKRLKQVPEGLRGDILSMKQNFANVGLYPIADSGAEHSIPFQDKLLSEYEPYYRLLFLRSPRHQIWSMFSHCYYSKWGKKATKGNFPRDNPTNDLLDYETWLDHFLDDTQTKMLLEPRNRTYKCYHPQNYQTRAFVVDHESPHVPYGIYEPDIQEVLATYWLQDWVGLTSFFHESKCLLYYRLNADGVSEEVSTMIQQYLEETCRCDVTSNSQNVSDGKEVVQDVKMIHATKGHRSTMLDIPAEILHKVDLLTKQDIAIYKTALKQFMDEMVWLEGKLGRRVICDDVLQRWDPELAYVQMSLKVLYHQTRTSSGQ